MIAGFFHIVGYHILERQHACYIHITCAGDKVFFVGILTSELESNQMATVVEILTVYTIVFHCMPAGRFHHTDAATILCRHYVSTDAGVNYATASKSIQRAVIFIRFGLEFRTGETGIAVIDVYKCFARVRWNAIKRNRLAVRLSLICVIVCVGRR